MSAADLHDPLCQASINSNDDTYFCICEFIAKVRADEQERLAGPATDDTPLWQRALIEAYQADLRAKVQALRGEVYGRGWIRRDDVLDLFKGRRTMDDTTSEYADLVNAGVAAMIRNDNTADAVEEIIALAEPMIRRRVRADEDLVAAANLRARNGELTRPVFPEHVHIGDAQDPIHCVWTRSDGERCYHLLKKGEYARTSLFTFGSGQHLNRDAAVLIDGATWNQAREIMYAIYRTGWSSQYMDEDLRAYARDYSPQIVCTITMQRDKEHEMTEKP